MTNNTNPRRSSSRSCGDCHRKLTSANCTIEQDYCDDCYELAGLEAAHQDGDHDTEANADCLMCDPNARADRSRPAVARIVTSHINHAACYAADLHTKDRDGRARCREAELYKKA